MLNQSIIPGFNKGRERGTSLRGSEAEPPVTSSGRAPDGAPWRWKLFEHFIERRGQKLIYSTFCLVSVVHSCICVLWLLHPGVRQPLFLVIGDCPTHPWLDPRVNALTLLFGDRHLTCAKYVAWQYFRENSMGKLTSLGYNYRYW